MEDKDNWENKFQICCYSKRLIDKLIELNKNLEKPIDIYQIKKAIFYARKYHGKQKRLSGEAYYSHPLKVAEMLCKYLPDTDMIIIAILHDTLEDTDLTTDMLTLIFNYNISLGVNDLTRIKKNGDKIAAGKMLIPLWSQKKYNILLIKLFDRLHNIQTLGIKSKEKITKTIDETLKDFLVLSVSLEIPDIETELINICKKMKQKMLDD